MNRTHSSTASRGKLDSSYAFHAQIFFCHPIYTTSGNLSLHVSATCGILCPILSSAKSLDALHKSAQKRYTDEHISKLFNERLYIKAPRKPTAVSRNTIPAIFFPYCVPYRPHRSSDGSTDANEVAQAEFRWMQDGDRRSGVQVAECGWLTL